MQPEGGVCTFWGPQNCLSAFVDNLEGVLWASSDHDLKHALGQFAGACEETGLKVSQGLGHK